MNFREMIGSLVKHLGKHKKPFIAAVCIITVLAGMLFSGVILPGKVGAEEYRGGFYLSPLDSDSIGADVDSKFILKSQKDISVEELTERLSIKDEPAPEIKEAGKREFLITPSRTFEEDKLYTFILKDAGTREITWTFQTASAFRVEGVFPGNGNTNVPVDTGIEIYFSHEDIGNIEDYFAITPSVKGRFEQHKGSVVFVPESLKPGTLYTVKIKKGLKLKGTSYSLKDDYTFMFETAFDRSPNTTAYLNYMSILNDFTSSEKPYLPLIVSAPGNNTNLNIIKIKSVIYAYKGLEAFMKAADKLTLAPIWSKTSVREEELLINDMEKVLEYEQELDVQQPGEKYIELPQTLPAGYYILKSTCENTELFTLIQITDIGVYAMKTADKTLVWVNDLVNKKPVEGAEVLLSGKGEAYKTDSDGIACVDIPGSDEYNRYEYYMVNTPDGRNSIVLLNNYSYLIYEPYQVENYWRYLQLDRNMYKPGDNIYFWGFVKNRFTDENIENLTIELDQGSNFYRFGNIKNNTNSAGGRYNPINEDQPIVNQTVKVANNAYEGTINLPYLEPGIYTLCVKKGDLVLQSATVDIKEYDKPSYKLDVIKDKKAVFAGEEVNYQIKAYFFEGTPVPDINIECRIDSSTTALSKYFTPRNVTTDNKGNAEVKFTMPPGNIRQGVQREQLTVRSTMPETGEITATDNLLVFYDDINVRLDTASAEGKCTVSAQVNSITLDRINDGSAADSRDFLGDPVIGKELAGTIYRQTYVRNEVGQRYDYVNKVVRPQYSYTTKKETVYSFNITTGEDGKAVYSFDLPEGDEGRYYAEVKTKDGSGGDLTSITHINSYARYDTGSTEYYLYDGEKRAYGETVEYYNGDKVNLEFNLHDGDKTDGRYLFITTQNGLKEYSPGNNPEYSFIFNETCAPNVYVTGIYFNGSTYISTETYDARYGYTEKELILEARTDKQSYRPGEDVVVGIQARDGAGNPQKAIVNLSIVDEAFFKLHESYANTLSGLYMRVSPGIWSASCTHLNHQISVGQTRGQMLQAIPNEDLVSSIRPSQINALNDAASLPDGSGILLREEFRDTAFFKTIELDENGYGEIRFKLPDNITAWRITLSGVTPDLLAGSDKVAISVTLPFFINYSMNGTYLTEDSPVIGVNAYGMALGEGENVYFELSDASDAGNTVKAQGKAFERVDIPLWKLDEGRNDIIIKAWTDSGLADSLKQTVNVLSSYRQVNESVFYKLTPGIEVQGGNTGMTRLVFSDAGRGAFLPQLARLAYARGNRIDQKLPVKVAAQLMQQYFGYDGYEAADSFKAVEYQQQDGGIALLPYGGSDADISAKLVGLVRDEVDINRLKQYFYNLLYDDGKEVKANVLYGLAALREPVLLKLDKTADIENLGIKDLIYIGLAYCEIFESTRALEIFNQHIMPNLEQMEPYYRINTGKDQDDILECTSLAAVLASKLDLPQKTRLYEYCSANNTTDILVNIEKLLYIENELKKAPTGISAFAYTLYGERHEENLENGRTFTINLPSQDIDQFKVESVEGDVGLISTFKADLSDDTMKDENLSLQRFYSVWNRSDADTFRQGDVVKVELKWNIASKAPDGSYEVTDYLPSGLKALNNPNAAGVKDRLVYRRIDGQKVTFHVSKDSLKMGSLVYYARIVSTGKYKAEAPVIQNVKSQETMNTGEEQVVIIQ